MDISADELTLDDLQNGYYIYQLKDSFRFGVDAVLLSDFADIKPGANVIDLGTGTGIIPILLAAKTKGKHFTGIDIQERIISVANMSVKYNGLEDRVAMMQADLKDAVGIFGPASFDAVVSNPPYMAGNDGKHSGNPEKAIARHEVACTLKDVVQCAATLVRPGGSFFMIHRPYRLAEIISTLISFRLEPKRLQLIYPYVDKEPTMVCIESMRGGRSGLTVEKPYIMYDR